MQILFRSLEVEGHNSPSVKSFKNVLVLILKEKMFAFCLITPYIVHELILRACFVALTGLCGIGL